MTRAVRDPHNILNFEVLYEWMWGEIRKLFIDLLEMRMNGMNTFFK